MLKIDEKLFCTRLLKLYNDIIHESVTTGK